MINRRTIMVSGQVEVATELIYVPADPFAVHLEFTEPDGAVVLWSLSRDTLRLGLAAYRAIGDGDISLCMCFCRGMLTLHLNLHPPGEHAILHGAVTVFRDFLHSTYTLVPPGRENEHVDYEGEIAKLLS